MPPMPPVVPGAPVVEDAVPEEYRGLADAKARALAAGLPWGEEQEAEAIRQAAGAGSAAGTTGPGGAPQATAVLRAVPQPRATAVLRAVPSADGPKPDAPSAGETGTAAGGASAGGPTAAVTEAAPADTPTAGAAARASSTGGSDEADPAGAPAVSTGWTTDVPLADVAALARAQAGATAADGAGAVVGGGLRGRILAVEGGYGSRRGWGRSGSGGQGPVLSAMLAAVAPQILLAAEAVDAVHLPSAGDPQTVFAHLRAAARHPGPLLVHLGGHLVADKRGAGLQLTLRDAKTGTGRSDGLAWSAILGELRARPADWDTLVIADLSAEQAAWPLVQSPQFTEGVPLWAVVAPDPEQIGTFTRALIECLHGGRPGAGPTLAPEQLRAQVHSVLRPDALVLAAYPPDRPVFKNTARQQSVPTAAPVAAAPTGPAGSAGPHGPSAGPAGSAAAVQVPGGGAVAGGAGAAATGVAGGAVAGTGGGAVPRQRTAAQRGPVSLLKPGVPATVRTTRPVSLLKGGDGLPTGELPAEQALGQHAAADSAAPGDSATTGGEGVSLAKQVLDQQETVDPAPQDAAAGQPQAQARTQAQTQARTQVQAQDSVQQPARDAGPAGDPEPASEPEPAREPGTGPTAAQGEAPAASPEPDAPPADYREALGRIVAMAEANDHDQAVELALVLEKQAVATHGPIAPPVLMIRQVLAHLARLAGDLVGAAELYREIAMVLLIADGPEAQETQQVTTNAEACWRAIGDPALALELAPRILELRAKVPGADGRKLRSTERYAAKLAQQAGA
ncbi:hypothetical protein LN042_00500 [Kitasatospora sp. RB6PN24]|uniref:hypothetical protein n=1 Tax=Kitasatospora humi TaxID=2893891 RepID=UPI001E63F5CF|nr:hypothetical protein [Kitasatospora humi]MCC9305608.1 hypothetical protein [Kitasatospora humi]